MVHYWAVSSIALGGGCVDIVNLAVLNAMRWKMRYIDIVVVSRPSDFDTVVSGDFDEAGEVLQHISLRLR